MMFTTLRAKLAGMKAKVLAVTAVAGAALMMAAPAAQAQHVAFGVSIGAPVYVAPAPVVVFRGRAITAASMSATTTDGARIRYGCVIIASTATTGSSTGIIASTATDGATTAKSAGAKRSPGGMQEAALLQSGFAAFGVRADGSRARMDWRRRGRGDHRRARRSGRS